MSAIPEPAVIIPTVKAGPPLADALAAMGPQWRSRCVVIDNAASPEALAPVLAHHPEVQVIAAGSNLGFAAAVNLGLGWARARGAPVAVLINDDVAVGPDALQALVGALLGSPDAGAAAGVLLQAGTDRVETAGVRCDASLASRDVGAGASRDTLGVPEPLGPSGGLAAYRLDALAGIGDFDPGFFAYYEDVDVALRLRAAGWRCVPAVSAVGDHLGSATLGWRSREKAEIVGRSRGRIVRKYGVHRVPAAWTWIVVELLAGCALAVELRSAAPLRARLDGFRAARTELPYPHGDVDRGGLGHALRTRLRRRYLRPGVRAR